MSNNLACKDSGVDSYTKLIGQVLFSFIHDAILYGIHYQACHGLCAGLCFELVADGFHRTGADIDDIGDLRITQVLEPALTRFLDEVCSSTSRSSSG